MGFNVSPLVYSKTMRVMASFLHRPIFAMGAPFRFPGIVQAVVSRGLRLLVYLDDMCVLTRPGALGAS